MPDTSETNDLAEGAGETEALTPNDNFEPPPHPGFVMLRNLGNRRFADDSNCTIGPPDRYFVSQYTDGPSTRWNVIDRQTKEWIRRFPTEAEAKAHANDLSRLVGHVCATKDGEACPDCGRIGNGEG